MAGTIRGKVECYASQNSASLQAQEIFKGWYDFMGDLVNAGVAQLISLQYGNGGTGTDYHDGANPFGHNGFAVFRFLPTLTRPNDWYVLGQWSDTTAFGTSPGNPGLIRGGTGGTGGKFGLAFASALESDGTTNASPWAGTTNKDGSDTKGDPVWAAPIGGSLAIWPVSNNFTHDTSKENTVEIYGQATNHFQPDRFGFIADDDCFFMYCEPSDAGNGRWTFFGPFIPVDDIAIPYPFTLFSEVGDLIFNLTYGDELGTSTRQGGCYHPIFLQTQGSGVSLLDSLLAVTSQPNTEYYDPPQYEAVPVYVTRRDGTLRKRGALGMLDPFLKVVTGMGDGSPSTDLSLIVFGSLGADNLHVLVPWDGVTEKRSSFTREGIST